MSGFGRRGKGAAVRGKLRLPGWIETAKYICESGSGEIVVVQCNYCQEEAALLLLSRRRGAGPVQAR